MDRSQLNQFLDNLLGWKAIGVDSNGNEITAAICPEMRSFLVAWLGDATPIHGFAAIKNADDRQTMAKFFRVVAESLEALQ